MIKKVVHSLYFKIIGSITLILLLLGFFSFIIIQKTTKSKIFSVERQITTIFSSALGKSILDQMLFSDPSIFQGLLNSLVDGETISFAYIVDENSDIVSHTFSPLIPMDIISEVEKSKESRVVKSRTFGTIYLTIEPLFNGMLGYMVIGQLLPDLTKLWLQIATITIISFILIGFIISVIISRSITNPLYNLIDAIEETDSYGIPIGSIHPYRTTEFKKLSGTINSMVTSISKSRDELKSAHNQIKNIFDYSLQIIIIGTDSKGLITLFNAGAEKILGYSAKEVIGKKTPLDIHLKSEIEAREIELSKELGREVKGFEVFTTKLFEDDYDEREWTYVKKDGSFISVNLIISSIKDENGEVATLVGFAQDITLRKKHELELTMHKNNLELLVESRTVELQESLDRLTETQKQLVESEKMASLGGLVAGVAHEINTPVGIGVTAASHLNSKTNDFIKLYNTGDLSRSDLEGFINLTLESSKIILSNMNRAANLINSFKQVAVDQSSEEKRTFKIHEYLDEILLSTRSKFKHTKHKIEVDCPKEFVITSYPGALSQIVTNLLLNSLIHGFEGIDQGVINIVVSMENSIVVIEYRDSGVGIEKDFLKRIFDPFFTTKRGHGGSGLGMNILYNLVTQTLKGSVTCSSNPGEGTTFLIKFPDIKSKRSRE